jgi:adenylate cyclase
MGRARWGQRKTALLIGVAVAAAGIGVGAYATHLLRRTELQTIDARFSIRGKQTPPSDIVLVAIDPTTLAELRNRQMSSEFPFPRRYDAKVIDNLRKAGAKVIAVDLDFSHPSGSEEESVALLEAVGRAHGKAVLDTVEVEKGGRTEILGGHLSEVDALAADARLPRDSDGAIRRFEYAYNGLHSFAVVAAETATGRKIHASRFEGGSLPVDFVGPSETIRSVSYSKVLLDQFSPSAIRGKIVIVGATAPILQDVHPTATSEGMPGPEIWANATSTLLQGVPLTNAPNWVDVLLIVLLGIAPPLGSLRVRRWRSLLDAVALAIAFTVATQIAFNTGWIWTFVYPLLALAVGTLGTLAVLYVGEAIERERVRDVFSRFVPGDVVDQVLESANENLRLGGVERDCTILFSDLRGFTSFSESQSPEHVIEVVNHYLNEMTEAIMAAGGTLIAYMGDGIMAAFGAPLQQDDHADRALRAAREMIGPRLERFNAWLAEQGHESGFAMGVGLNSGPVMAGNVGSEQRVEYTTIGDTTNTASRLEGMTKGSGHMLFCAQSTRERMQDPLPADLVLVGELEVRGREAKLPVWTLAAETPVAGGDSAAGAAGRTGETETGGASNAGTADAPRSARTPASDGAQAGSGV